MQAGRGAQQVIWVKLSSCVLQLLKLQGTEQALVSGRRSRAWYWQ